MNRREFGFKSLLTGLATAFGLPGTEASAKMAGPNIIPSPKTPAPTVPVKRTMEFYGHHTNEYLSKNGLCNYWEDAAIDKDGKLTTEQTIIDQQKRELAALNFYENHGNHILKQPNGDRKGTEEHYWADAVVKSSVDQNGNRIITLSR